MIAGGFLQLPWVTKGQDELAEIRPMAIRERSCREDRVVSRRQIEENEADFAVSPRVRESQLIFAHRTRRPGVDRDEASRRIVRQLRTLQ
ncbi:MAG: hypothetical protein J07HR59_00028 [Halorubrum sp. J07HR59]|nr:MAG: hypothetical protein J07HR59_00028 [Halorubrum sp. J07HR59]